MENLNSIQAMSYSEYAEYLLKYTNIHEGELHRCVNCDLADKGILGHGMERHINIPIKNLLKSNIEEKKNKSCFYTLNEYELTLKTLFQKQGIELAQAYFRANRNHMPLFVMKVSMSDFIGHGIDIQYNYVKAKTAILVFSSAKDKNSDLGIVLKTAYLDIQSHDVEYTGINYRPAAERLMDEFSFQKDFILRYFKDIGYDKVFEKKDGICVITKAGMKDTVKAIINLKEDTIKFQYHTNEYNQEIMLGDIIMGKCPFLENVKKSLLDIPEIFDEANDAYAEYKQEKMMEDEIENTENYDYIENIEIN